MRPSGAECEDRVGRVRPAAGGAARPRAGRFRAVPLRRLVAAAGASRCRSTHDRDGAPATPSVAASRPAPAIRPAPSRRSAAVASSPSITSSYRQSVHAPIAAAAAQPRGGAVAPSVPEVAPAGEDHRDARAVGRLDHLVVAHRAARLDDRGRRPRRSPAAGPSGNGKNASEAIAAPASEPPRRPSRSRAAPSRRGSSARRRCPTVARSLASTIAFERTCLQTRQREQHLAPLLLGRPALGRRPAFGALLEVDVAVLHQQAADDLLELGLGEAASRGARRPRARAGSASARAPRARASS